jgi:tetratricopeptide (TPR) repeat protein
VADGIIESPVGGEAQREESAAPVSAAAVAAAIALDEAAKSPGVAADASAFLKSQKSLVDLQVKHFDQERRLAIHAAKLKRAMDWLKLATQTSLALVVIALVIGLASLIWNAAHDRGLVIEPFAVSPDVGEHKIKGEQLAALIADQIATIDAHAPSFRAPETYLLDWSNDIHIELPATGISIGELERYLRRRLGDQTRIGGTLYEVGNDLHLSVRIGSGASLSVAGEAAQLDDVIRRAAEAVVAKTQPYRYSKYLEFAGRTDEAMGVARELAAAGPPGERAWAWAQISNLLPATDMTASYSAAMEAIRINPNIALGYFNAAIAPTMMGHDQQARDLIDRGIELSRHGGGGLSEIGRDTSRFIYSGYVALLEGDALTAAKAFEPGGRPLYRGVTERAPTMRAGALAFAHDVTGSRQVLGALPDSEWATYVEQTYYVFQPAYLRAVSLEDWPGAIAAARSQLQGLAQNPKGEFGRYGRERVVMPCLAFALAQAGQMDEARNIAAALPNDCYLCLRAKGWIAGKSGDLEQAEREFREAIRQNPELPFADLQWGELLLSQGNLTNAGKHFARASELGPRFADPLKYFGDVLLSQGEVDRALAKYVAAATLTPRWGGLHLVWAKALWRAGRKTEARARLAAAATMDLSVADRGELVRAQSEWK